MRYLLVIPAAAVGWFGGTFFIGILPTVMMDSFIVDFHYTSGARWWIRMAGAAGMVIAPVIVAVLCWSVGKGEE